MISPFEEPKIKELLIDSSADDNILKVNNHIHSPFSFSAFANIGQAVQLAVKEGISVLGINDFFVTHGYEEFNKICFQNSIYPLFNVEFIGLHKQFQSEGLRINDPNNPGRIYISGKGLKKSFNLSDENQKKFDVLIDSSQLQIKEMISKLNEWLKTISSPFAFSYPDVKQQFAKELVRERHIASAIRDAVESEFSDQAAKIDFYTKLFSAAPQSDISIPSAIEEEIRGKLLKAGGKAFVAEDEKAFLSPDEIKSIVSEAGGIITYPLLLDDKNGNYTDFEKDKEYLSQILKEMGIFSIEFIPGRNSLEALQEYSKYFYERGFLVSYGTEHNSPALNPLEVTCRGGVNLDKNLLEINYNCACVLAAHQYLIQEGYEGYLDAEGKPNTNLFSQFKKLGNSVIKKQVY
jgi:hypothetical protein